MSNGWKFLEIGVFCKNGHLMTENTLYINKNTKHNTRYCKICRNEQLKINRLKIGNGEDIKVRGRITHCIRGHELTNSNTYTRPCGTRECKICKKMRETVWRDSNRERYNEITRKSTKKGKYRIKNYTLVKKFGITKQEYDTKLLNQNGKCAICGSDSYNSMGHSFAVDHCHETGVVRDLLCSDCNKSLGFVEKVGIENIVLYLRKHNNMEVCENGL